MVLLCHTVASLTNLKLASINIEIKLLTATSKSTISHVQRATSSFQAFVIVIISTNCSIIFIQYPLLTAGSAAFFQPDSSAALFWTPFSLYSFLLLAIGSKYGLIQEYHLLMAQCICLPSCQKYPFSQYILRRHVFPSRRLI